MSTTWVNRIFVLLFFLVICPGISEAGDIDSLKSSSDFSIGLELMPGINYNTKDDSFKSKKLNFSPSLRILWKPGYRLNMGIESSYLIIRQTTHEKNHQLLQGKLEAIPFFLVYNMKIMFLDVTGGVGVSFIRSTINALGDESKAINWHYCYNFGLGYTQNLSKSWGIGVESKLLSFTKTDEVVVSACLKLIYNIYY